MADALDMLGLDPALLTGAVFIASFVALLFFWSLFVRLLFSVLGKSGLFFVPKTLKELFLTMAFLIALISLESSALITGRTLLSGEMFKIWQILLIFAVANVFTRVVLTGLDVQHKKAKDRSGMYRSIGLLKSTIGIVLYLIAVMISVYVLSAELGAAVIVIGLFIIAVFFAAGFDQARSIVAGLQLGDYYVDEGSLVTIDGHTGFVESVHGRSTVVRKLDGTMAVIPNHRFFSSEFIIDPDELSQVTICAKVSGKEPQKTRERLSSIASKVAIGRGGLPSEFKPRAYLSRIEGAEQVFLIVMKVTPASDMRSFMDSLSGELSSEFGERLKELKLGE